MNVQSPKFKVGKSHALDYKVDQGEGLFENIYGDCTILLELLEGHVRYMTGWMDAPPQKKRPHHLVMRPLDLNKPSLVYLETIKCARRGF
jgi:hypothetical protein